MIIRFACLFLGLLCLFAFYELAFEGWFSWLLIPGLILLISHALNPKWSEKIQFYFMNKIFDAGIEPIDQACISGNMKMVEGYSVDAQKVVFSWVNGVERQCSD